MVIGNPVAMAWSWFLFWFLSWVGPAAISTGVTWQSVASIIVFGLVAGVVVDMTEMIAYTRWVTQTLLVQVFLALLFQVGFGLPKYWHSGHTGHYANSVVDFLLLSTFYVAVALGMKAARLIRARAVRRRVDTGL